MEHTKLLFAGCRSPFRIFLNVVLLLCLVCTANAQHLDKKTLEKKKKKLKQDIELAEQLLKATKDNKKKTLNTLVVLNKNIEKREELIYTINSEINLMSQQIEENNTSIKNLHGDIKKLKQEYGRMVYFAYKNRDNYDKLIFVFAAADFNQAYKRLKYIQEYNEARKKQIAAISQKQKELGQQVQDLEQKKTEKKDLLGNQETEKKDLTQKKEEKEEMLTDLQGKESQLKKDLEKKKKDAERTELAIQALIKAEIERQQKLAALAAEKAEKEKAKENGTHVKPAETAKASLKYHLSKDELDLNQSFSNNKGKLPMPVIQGVITEGFGPHEHPTIKNFITVNNGVTISTGKGSLARSIFQGEVTGVTSIPGVGKLVIVRHGEFLSVYANLEDVYVQTGDKVKAKQNIGKIQFDPEEGRTEMNLQIWKGQTKLNPEDWLYKD
ncbi:MAG TPA: peptidoglycan DD-metalloendopeptidase family protein [Bacteroidia bacterium]|jgi:septal ring factor EnvC (AmiA/AmiB activator)|nr:peptidoglycan DD-metalloendopeptidase family protein [Bacteroidia bacterium]